MTTRQTSPFDRLVFYRHQIDEIDDRWPLALADDLNDPALRESFNEASWGKFVVQQFDQSGKYNLSRPFLSIFLSPIQKFALANRVNAPNKGQPEWIIGVAQRMETVRLIGPVKAILGQEPRDEARFQAILKKQSDRSESLNLPRELMISLFESLHNYALELEALQP